MNSDGRSRGFSLIEVLIALAVLAVGLLAVARLQTAAINSLSFSRHLSTATQLAEQQIEFLRSLPYNAIDETDIPQDQFGANIQSCQGSWCALSPPLTDASSASTSDGMPGPWHQPTTNPVNAIGQAASPGEMTFYIRWRVERGPDTIQSTFVFPHYGQAHIRVQVIWWERSLSRPNLTGARALLFTDFNPAATRAHVVELETVRQGNL